MAKPIIVPMSKADLRKIYRQWAKEELDSIILIEAVAKYLGEK